MTQRTYRAVIEAVAGYLFEVVDWEFTASDFAEAAVRDVIAKSMSTTGGFEYHGTQKVFVRGFDGVVLGFDVSVLRRMDLTRIRSSKTATRAIPEAAIAALCGRTVP